MQAALQALASDVACFSGRTAHSAATTLLSGSTARVPRSSSTRQQWTKSCNHKSRLTGRVQASADGNSDLTSRAHLQSDPYSEAGSRLQKLLRGATSTSERQELDGMLQELNPDTRIGMTVVAGAFVGIIATTLAQFGGNDPWGGASWSLKSVQAVVVGAVAALPLIIMRAVLWSDTARQELKALQGLREREVDKAGVLVEGMDNTQIAVLSLAEVVPSSLMIMPAAQGDLTNALGVCGNALRDAGIPLASCAPVAAAMAIAVTLAALPAAGEMMPELEAVTAVVEAKINSARYYASLPKAEAERAEEAFDRVLLAWGESWVGTSTMALTLSLIDWGYASLLWRATGDLTAPIVACFLWHCVDFKFVQQTRQSQQRQRT